MTDHELLEMAAKAAGWVSWDWLGNYGVLNVYDAHGRHDTFAPLTDDGDALRLAVQLGMHCVGKFPVPSLHLINECGGDQYAATRRAITSAAAEIGKAMP